MKTLFFAFLVTQSLLAQTALAQGVKHICKEMTDYQRQTLVLTQVYDRDIKEGVRERFTLEVYPAGVKQPRLVKSGYVSTEDVMFQFESDDKKVSVSLYMDEMDQTTLSEKGKKDVSFDCH